MAAMRSLVPAIVLASATLLAIASPGSAQPRRPAAGAAPRVYTATLPVAQMRNKQAVVTTSLGAIVIELLPDAAPDHVGYVMKLAEERAYDGTTFLVILRPQAGRPVVAAAGRNGRLVERIDSRTRDEALNATCTARDIGSPLPIQKSGLGGDAEARISVTLHQCLVAERRKRRLVERDALLRDSSRRHRCGRSSPSPVRGFKD